MTGPAPLSDAEITQLKATFDSLAEGKGLTANALAEIYRKANVSVSQEDIEKQLRAADTKGHGRVDFDDFLAVMTRQHQHNPEEGLARVFDLLDTDKDGQISRDELERGIIEFGESTTQQEIKEMVLSADVDGDGLINYEEFVKILTPSKVNGQ